MEIGATKERDAREKNVIRALELCTFDGTIEHCIKEGCPYLGGNGVGYCIDNLMRDALALLKAQEPRLVQAEDFMGANGKCDEAIPCWKEPKSPTRREGWAVIVYGKWLADKGVCRYWTGRPDEAQKEAEPWPRD